MVDNFWLIDFCSLSQNASVAQLVEQRFVNRRSSVRSGHWLMM